MNLIKGIDRIALIIAILALIPCFFIGKHVGIQKSIKVSPIVTKLLDSGWREATKDEYGDVSRFTKDSIYLIEETDEGNINGFTVIPLYVYSNGILYGAVFSLVMSAIIFSSILILSRVAKKSILWITKGFRDE